MDKLVELARSQAVRRTAVGLYVLALAGVVGAFFIISLFEVENSTYLLAHDTIEKGRPNAVRGVVFDTPTGKFVRDATVEVSLYDFEWGGESTVQKIVEQKLEGTQIASGRTEPTGHIQLQMKPPGSVEPGTYAIVVHATGQKVSENYYTGRDIQVVPRGASDLAWPEKTHRLPEDNRPDHDEVATNTRGPIAVDLLPRDGGVIRGVESTVYLRTYYRDTGEPVRATVELAEVKGINETTLPEAVKTDAMGLARVRWTPGTDQNWTVRVSDAAERKYPDAPSELEDDDQEEPEQGEATLGEATLRITTVPAQYSMTLSDSLVEPGGQIEGYVKSLNRSGGMMVDLYDGDAWTVADAFGMQEGASGLRLTVPTYDGIGKLQRVQVYGGIYGVGRAWDSKYVWLTEDTDRGGQKEALREVISFHAEHTGDRYFEFLDEQDAPGADTADDKELSRWARAYLDSIPTHFDPPPELINSEKEAKARMDEWKSGIKSRLIYLTGFGLFVGMMVVLYFVVMGIRSSREHDQMLREVDTDLAIDGNLDEDAEDVVHAARVDDWIVWFQVAIVVTTLAFFAAGILLLLSFM
ncbi:MAG: hypothetical protein ACQEVA_07210 [Myxococcota bacterium]